MVLWWWSDGQTDFKNFFFSAVLDLMLFFSRDCRFWSDNDIYFFSGRYCCSNVAAADAVADVAVAVGPVFVECYHCHLPRSSYKHGASLKAAYPLLYHSFSFNSEWRREIYCSSLILWITWYFVSGRNSLWIERIFKNHRQACVPRQIPDPRPPHATWRLRKKSEQTVSATSLSLAT